MQWNNIYFLFFFDIINIGEAYEKLVKTYTSYNYIRINNFL